MHARLPTTAVLLGAAGLLPFIFCGIWAVGANVNNTNGLIALIAYGAAILAFLGGVHWGFALTPLPAGVAPTEGVRRTRLVLGVLPSLIGWVALLAPIWGVRELGLVVLIVGFLATVLSEAQLNRRGLMPHGYMWLRWALSVVVLMILITVLTLRLIGGTVNI